MANPLFMYCMQTWAWHGKRFSFMVSFEMFLNSNCSTDSTNFWKRFDHFSGYFLLLPCFCYTMFDRFHMMWIHGLWLYVLNMNSFIYVNWSGSDLRWNLNYTDGFDLLSWTFPYVLWLRQHKSCWILGICHLHGYIGFYGVNKFSDCSPFCRIQLWPSGI